MLRGRDHIVLGEIASREIAPRAAVAISRGEQPKAYWYADPNEDVVAVAGGRRALLLVCADGHNGREAPERAVAHLLEALAADPPPADLDDEGLVSLFHGAGEAVVRATGGPQARDPDSRTTLALALVAERRLQWASFGDSGVFTVARRGAERLDRPAHRFVGHPTSEEEVARRLARGTIELPPDRWVVLATDGFIDFAGRRGPERALAKVLDEHSADPGAAARALVERAFGGGAGDNVGVALAAPAG